MNMPSPAAGKPPFQVQLVAETSLHYVIGGQTFEQGLLGLPSLSAPSGSTSHWNLAVRGYSHFPIIAERVQFYTNGTPLAHYSVAGGEASLPSAQFNTAAYHISNVGVYSGSTLLDAHYLDLGFGYGRPSAQSQFIAVHEFPAGPGLAGGIVVHGPSGSTLIASTADGFDALGLVTGPDAQHDISFGRGGLHNVVFRGHHASDDTRNGIFVRRYDATQPLMTVADNTMTNPKTGLRFTFSDWYPERLPVAHGAGAAWSMGTYILSKPDIAAVVPTPIQYSAPGTYGNVSSGGAGMLAYEFLGNGWDPRDKVIMCNLMGWDDYAVVKDCITQLGRRTVLEVSMGSEALVPNPFPLSKPATGGFTLGFHAHQLNTHYQNAVYVTTIAKTGVDLGGMFGADRHEFSAEPAQFSIRGGGSTGGSPEDTDFITVTAQDSAHFPNQNYGFGLGVDSGPGDDDPVGINTLLDGTREGLSIRADYNMIVDAVTFMGLDPGETVRFLLDGVLVMEETFKGNQVSMVQGLQCIQLDSLFVPVGSAFTIEHGGGADDGFRVSSVVFETDPCAPAADEDFELHPPGTVCGIGGFIPWQNGNDVCGEVSTEQASSGNRSLKIVGAVGGAGGLGDDTVLPVLGVESGVWTFRCMTFIPSDATGDGAIVLLNTYDDVNPPQNSWYSAQVRFRAGSALVQADLGAGLTAMVKGQWVEFRIEIDLDNDLADYFYNGVEFVSDRPWTDGVVPGSPGPARLRAIDFYGGEPSTDGITAMYIDDVTITPPCNRSGGADCNGNGVDDADDIAAGTSRDCYNAEAGSGGSPDGIPDECQCVADWNFDGTVNSTDVGFFINSYFSDQSFGTSSSDINCDGVSNSTDVSDFINLWFSALSGQLPYAGCSI